MKNLFRLVVRLQQVDKQQTNLQGKRRVVMQDMFADLHGQNVQLAEGYEEVLADFHDQLDMGQADTNK